MTTKLGDLINQRLKDRGWSQTDLADRVGMTPSQISRIISGNRGTTIENLVAIADSLNINRDLFLRAAANLSPEKGIDSWVEEQLHKLKQIPPELRPAAGRVIAGFVEEEKASHPARQSPKIRPASS